MIQEPPFTIGVEEEYLLVDTATRDLVADPDPGLMRACEERLAGQVSPELLRSQIEVGTPVSASIREADEHLRRLRSTVSEEAERFGYAIIAASTHPFARWSTQQPTPKQRYLALTQDIGGPARRMLICGMHVHVCVGDDDLRAEMSNQITYFLPHLLALSTSSPYWEGEDTGLMSYRLSVFDELPRTGLPEKFESYAEYERHVSMLVDAGILEDASKIWWDVRPSCRFPTLEMRICDMCTSVADTVAIAAIYVCLLRMLWRLRCDNQRWRSYANMLVAENRWRAQRYGMDGGLVDFGKGEIVAYQTLFGEILELIRPDASALNCLDAIAHARSIVDRGTSAHRQRAAFDAAVKEGASKQAALRAVVDTLIAETKAGL